MAMLLKAARGRVAETTANLSAARALCEDLGIDVVATGAPRRRRATCAVGTIAALIRNHGADHATVVLQVILAGERKRGALVEAVLWAVSDTVLHRGRRGPLVIGDFAGIDLEAIYGEARGMQTAVAPRDAVSTLLNEAIRMAA